MAQVGSTRRGTRHQRMALGASFLVAALVHAAAVGGADATGVFSGWGGAGTVTRAPMRSAPSAPGLAPSCDGDAVLAAAARAMTCASPFSAGVDACMREVAVRLESDRLRCHVEELRTVAFTLAPIDARTLEQIDPEPLLDSVSPERQQAFEDAQAAQQVALVALAERRRTVLERDAQVVEIARPTVEVAPDAARFVSEYDNKVDRQSVARGSNREDMVARSKPAELEVKNDPREAAVAEHREPDTVGQNPDAAKVPGLLRMRAPGTSDPAPAAQEAHHKGIAGGSDGPLGNGARSRRGDGLISSEARRPSDLPAGGGGAGGGTPQAPDLRPSEDVLERAVGGGSVDHLDDVEDGDETSLSTKQFVFATFFNRMKRRVHQNWDPVSVWHRHDPTGQVYGFKTRITRVRITLNPSGEMTKIIVANPSGVDLLDDEAVRAFRAAQPFPNPPAGLVDATGNITFDFGFHLEIGGGRKATWKIFRAL